MGWHSLVENAMSLNNECSDSAENGCKSKKKAAFECQTSVEVEMCM